MIGFIKSAIEDIQAVFESDPAAKSMLEVVLCYPGLHALWTYRISHWMWHHQLPLTARLLSQLSRFFTGIEIHPAAQIGKRFFIDHGMGVVVGETSIIGNDVTLYQGVTLGGTGKEKGKRHPTIQDGVVIGSGAKVLGNITVGSNSRVGAGSVVLRDVPPNSTIVGVPGHIVFRNGQRVVITDPKQVSDPLSDVLVALAEQQQELKREVYVLANKTMPTEDDFATQCLKHMLLSEEMQDYSI